MSTPKRHPAPKRWHTPAYWDGITRAYLGVAETALIHCSYGRNRPRVRRHQHGDRRR